MDDVEQKFLATFAAVAESIGYSDVHGRILGALMLADKELSMQELAGKTGYSLATISLSLDLLELIGFVQKIKNPKDRNIYVRLDMDIIEGLRAAMLMKIKAAIRSTRAEIESHKNNSKSAQKLSVIEREISRLEQYIEELAKVKVPK